MTGRARFVQQSLSHSAPHQTEPVPLIVLDNKSLANITRCVLESADKTNLSRFFSEAPWFQERVNDRRLMYLLQQTQAVRGPKADSVLMLDDTLCEHVGSLFDYVTNGVSTLHTRQLC